MNQNLQDTLFKKYPKIFKERNNLKSIMYKGIEVEGDGWFNLIDVICADIQTFCDLYPEYQVTFSQVKESFGRLNLYVYIEGKKENNIINYDFFFEYVDSICTLGEKTSEIICEECGQPLAQICKNKNGRLRCLCAEHRTKLEYITK